jgi:putative ABC transport system permease protein
VKKQKHKSSVWRWSKASLRFFKWRHLIFAFTAALAAAILSAALSAGESLHAGLQRDLNARLGEVRSAVIFSDGLFPSSLSERVKGSEAALMLRGEMLDASGMLCAGDINVLGISENDADSQPLPGMVSVNQRAQEVVNSLDGGTWSYRFEKPSQFSVELPLGNAGAPDMQRRMVAGVRQVATHLITADFDTSSATVLPVNIRVSRSALAKQAGVAGMANVLVSHDSPEQFRAALQNSLMPQDIGLDVVCSNGISKLKSSQVFLPSAFCRALSSSGADLRWASFHLADAFMATNGLSTPYGFVGALSPEDDVLPGTMADDQIVVNQWLADKLSLRIGDMLTMKSRRFEAGGKLVPEERSFKVCKILTMEQALDVKALMPVLPGLSGVDSCADWDVGMPMDEIKLKDPANEAYWKEWRETPKAFITFTAGKELFGTYFGEAMCVQVKGDTVFVDNLVRGIDPAELGFSVRALWQEGVAAAKGSTDFRGLFVGMAFILMLSALILAGLSLRLTLDSRNIEPALFSALGIRRGRVVRMICSEWLATIVLGCVAGALLGSALARSLIWTLSRFWSDAFAGAQIKFYFSWKAVVLASLITIFLLVMMLVRRIYKYAGAPPVEVLRQSNFLMLKAEGRLVRIMVRVLGPICALGAIGIIYFSAGSQQVNGAFFGAGFLLMISILLFVKGGAELWYHGASSGEYVINDPLRSGVIRALHSGARGRSLVLLLSVGVFLTIGMLAMKHDTAAGWELRSSGSGGFASIVRSSVAYSLESGIEMALKVTGSKQAVSMRVRDGDEAGCMNMSVPQVPRLYGVSVSEMATLRAFEPEDSGGLWSVLYDQLEEGVIPALAADQAMLQYSLKMKADVRDGDEILCRGSDGKEWRIRIVGVLPVRVSILQGGLILNEEHFLKMFPAEGCRMWLCDYAPYALRVNGDMKCRYPQPGVKVETTVERLRLLGRMESTYLDMFLVLGGLGLALGIFGVILVIARSVEERRYEFAVFQAVGLKKRAILLSVFAEYGVLISAGIFSGLIPALIAIQPAAHALSSGISWGLIGAVTTLLALSAAISVAAGALYAMRGFDVSLLKRE